MAALYLSRYKEPRVCGLDIKRTMKIGLCWGIYEGPWFLHHEEENTTELEVDQKFYVLITKITRNNYLLVKQLPTCSEGAEAFLVIGFQYELCFRIPKFFRISQHPKNLFMNPHSLFDLACTSMWCPKSTKFLSFATGVQKVLNLSPFQQKYLPLLDHLLRHTCVISVCTLFAHFPFHQNVLSNILDLHWSKWSVNAVRDNCQGNFNEIRRGFSRQASLGQVVRDGNSDHLQNAFGFIRRVFLRLHRTSIIDEIGLFARVALSTRFDQ